MAYLEYVMGDMFTVSLSWKCPGAGDFNTKFVDSSMSHIKTSFMPDYSKFIDKEL
jgi:hypothetical protein